jgi:hypothetical protein
MQGRFGNPFFITICAAWWRRVRAFFRCSMDCECAEIRCIISSVFF